MILLVMGISSETVTEKSVTIVSAANARYFTPLVISLENIRKRPTGSSYRIIVYDLGLAPVQSEMLRSTIPHLVNEVRSFDEDKIMPAHVRKLGCYAWKPVIVEAVYREFGSVVWIDSGNSLHASQINMKGSPGFFEAAVETAAAQGGVLSDRTARTWQEFTHPGMTSYFSEHWPGWDRDRFEGLEPKMENCNGAFSSWAKSPMADRVLFRWKQCAMDQKCVCPPGSNRGNHRQDQAALTLLTTMEGLRCTDFKWVSAHGVHPGKVNATLIIAHWTRNNERS